MAAIERIWLKRMRWGPMDPVARATLRAGRGLAGNQDQGGRRQITIISAERWSAVQQELGVPLEPVRRRANLLVRGLDLANTRGRVLRLGPCRVRVLGETRPCEQMEAAQPGLRKALAHDWGGGVFAEVLDDGEIAVGDPAAWETEA